MKAFKSFQFKVIILVLAFVLLSTTVRWFALNNEKNGYPNRSVEKLGVNDEDEAYLATQVALWTLFEGYNVKKIDTGNAEVNAAARNIYNNVINNKRYELENDTILYRTNDSNIQGIVIYVKQPIEIKPIPPTEVVPPVVVPPEEVIPPTNDEKPTVDNNNNNTTDEGTAGVSDNIQNDAPLGK